MKELIGAAKAAKMAQVSRATIYRAIRDRRIKPSLNKNGKYVFKSEDVQRYIDLRNAWYSAPSA
jgi:predicted site-specific integrase-resolvase